MKANRPAVLREGVVAGALGALGVAIWFLGVDIVAGRPFNTPTPLGRVLLSILGGADRGPVVNTLVYTVFHFAAFGAVGIVASKLIHMARRMPHLTIGLMLFFVTFQLGFYFVALALSQFDVIGTLGLYQIGAANLIASIAMGWFLWRLHPELAGEFKAALDGHA